jgi:hypothetical protein
LRISDRQRPERSGQGDQLADLRSEALGDHPVEQHGGLGGVPDGVDLPEVFFHQLGRDHLVLGVAGA